MFILRALHLPTAILFPHETSVTVATTHTHREDTGAGNTVTFFQFLFISIEGLVFVSHFFTVTPNIPLRWVVLAT